MIVFLSIAGGMPESTLLALTFGYCYFLFRILTDPGLRSQARKHVIRFILANVLGFAISAFLLAPFVEFLRVSSDSHQSHNISGLPVWGLRHDDIGPLDFHLCHPTDLRDCMEPYLTLPGRI